MRTVRYTSRFRRDHKRDKSGRHGTRLDADLRSRQHAGEGQAAPAVAISITRSAARGTIIAIAASAPTSS
jgi:hypothetical protein